MRLLFRVLVLVSLLTVSATGHADDKAVQKVLAANYAQFNQSFQKNDPRTFASMLAPDYAAIQPNGQKIGAAEMVANFTRERNTLKTAEVRSKIANITVKGNQATVTVHTRLDATMSDPHGKEPHKLLVIADSKDTWIKKESVWKLKLDQVIRQTVTLDGKPVGGAGGESKGTRVDAPGK